MASSSNSSTIVTIFFFWRDFPVLRMMLTCHFLLGNSFNLSPGNASSRSQWPRDLRHELTSLARALGSWVRNPLEAWMSVFILCLCYVAALRRADRSSKESYRMS
jgi:hypothetical protein